jgi:dienelactone hydrolase
MMADIETLERAPALTATGGAYTPGGWMQWPDHLDFSFQFVRALASAQDGAATIGECFLTAGRITEGDYESWHREWLKIGDVNRARAEAAEAKGFTETARANWMRACNYYRSAEYFLDHDDLRRLETFDKVEACGHRWLDLMTPKGEIVQISYGDADEFLYAYFLPTPYASGPAPTMIAFGGLDEFKDEDIQHAGHALKRGISLLLIDLPGQGGTIRRNKLIARPDTEVPVGACVDYLESRVDVDAERIGIYGASLGGYYAPRAAAFEHRLKCCVVDGAQFNVHKAALRLQGMGDTIQFMHAKWVFGGRDMAELLEITKAFNLEGVASNIRCPAIVVHGDQDIWGVQMALDLIAEIRKGGADVTEKWFTPEETGAQHCQVDNPTLGMEVIWDWVSEKLGARGAARGD